MLNRKKSFSLFLSVLLSILFSICSTQGQAQIFNFLKKPEVRPRISFRVDPNDVVVGDSVKISWKVVYDKPIDTLIIDGKDIKPEGFYWINATSDEDFNLKLVTADGQTLKRRRSIKVRSPIIHRFQGPEYAFYNSPFQLEWNSSNANKAFLNDEEVPITGTQTVSITADSTFVMRIETKSGYSIQSSISVECKYMYNVQASINGVHKSPQDKIPYIRKSLIELSWQLDAAQKISINRDPIESNSGKLRVNPSTDSVFVFRFTTHDDRDSSLALRMEVIEPRPIIFSLENKGKKSAQTHRRIIGYAEEIPEHNPYVLSWAVTQIDTVYIDDKPYPSRHSLELIAQKNRSHWMRYNFINHKGKRSVYRHRIDLVIEDRPYFSEGIKSDIELKNEKLYMDVFAVDLSQMPHRSKLKVVVVDSLGNFVSGLDKAPNDRVFKHIIETYRGKKTLINNFRVKEFSKVDSVPPQDIMLVLDNSGSMYMDYKRMDGIARAYIRNKRPQDRISFVKFDHELKGTAPFMFSVDSLLNEYNKFPFDSLGGMTALYAATDLGMLTLHENKHEGREQQVIVFTDGYENFSFIYFEHLSFTAFDVVSRARHLGIPINIISLGIAVNRPVLQAIADVSYGHYYPLDRVHKVDLAMKEIFNIRSNYYEVSYTPYKIFEEFAEFELFYETSPNKTKSATKQVFASDDLSSLVNMDPVSIPSFLMQSKTFPAHLKPVAAPQNFANFNLDKDKIRKEDMKNVKTYAKFLSENPEYEAVLVGYTDLIGSDEYCYDLGMRRAVSAKEALVKEGIDENRLYSVGLGKENPIWPVSTKPIHDFENRRVEIIILKPK